MPILGVIASSISGHLTPAYDSSSYYSIASVDLTSSASSVTFAGIPSGFKHLQIRAYARCDYAAEILDTYWTFNTDTSASYWAAKQLRANGSTLTATSDSANNASRVFVVPGTSTAANIFSAGIIDILDYANTNKYKTLRSLNGNDASGSGNIFYRSSLWMNTSAINTITITAESTSSFIQYSSFALYGVK